MLPDQSHSAFDLNQPSTSSFSVHLVPENQSKRYDKNSSQPISSKRKSHIEDLIPIPHSVNQTKNSHPKRKGRPKQHSEVLTATPNKTMLEGKQKKKKLRNLKTAHSQLKKSRNADVS